MKTRNVEGHTRVREEVPTERDPYARESFTWRRMTPGRIWTLLVAAVILAILGVIWVN